MTATRKATNRILEMIDEGLVSPEYVVRAALSYMSEDDVAEMARSNDIIIDEDDEGEDNDESDEWDPYTADYNDKGSYHHW